MLIFKYLFIFCLFSVIGWMLEVVYRSIVNKKLINPGFMSGCVLPIYGFGAVILNIVCTVLDKINFQYKVLLIFFVATLLLSLLEFISGYVLYKYMNLKLWDYSNLKYNYKGFISLEFSFVWGLLSLIFYIFIYPWINSLAIAFISSKIGIFLLGIYIGIFIIDLSVSINLLSKFVRYSRSIKDIINVERLKLESIMETKRRKVLNAIYPYISVNKFLKDKLKK